MKNYVQPGGVVAINAPADCKAGDLIKVGNLAGVAAYDGVKDHAVEIAIEGVFDLVKATKADTYAVGDKVYSGTGGAAKTGTGAIGICIAVSSATSDHVRVVLDGRLTA
jgi:predicted RecA/RadA family phage recombinase